MGEDERKSREWSIDIDHANDLEEVLVPGPDCCIYKVPQYLREINERAYTPRLISIGPLHYGNKELMMMENQKKRYWSKFWSKFGQRNEVSARILEEFKTHIETQEKKIRACYSVTSTHSSSKYIKIILRDAVFIIELFKGKQETSDDFLLKDPLKSSITTDLLLLENQLPYFILNELYAIAFHTSKQHPSEFFKISVDFFNGMSVFNPLSTKAEAEATKEEAEAEAKAEAKAKAKAKAKTEAEAAEQAIPTSTSEGMSVHKPLLAKTETEIETETQAAEQPNEQLQGKHFTDILRRSLLKTMKSNRDGDKLMYDVPCATKLYKSGLEFVDPKDECLFNISFDKRKLSKWLPWFEVNEVKIPRIEILDNTECLLRNLMALEMFLYPTETHICNYAVLMDYLVDTEKDVDLLVEKRIIFNGLGDNKAICNMFNSLCKQVIISDSCYYKDVEDMKTHYKINWNHAKAALKSVYFNNIWTGTATFAATFLLILTVIQTVCSIVQL